jgi:hypothetical protein
MDKTTKEGFIMETRDVFVNDDNFDHREALEAAVDTINLNGCLCSVYKNKIKYDPMW